MLWASAEPKSTGCAVVAFTVPSVRTVRTVQTIRALWLTSIYVASLHPIIWPYTGCGISSLRSLNNFYSFLRKQNRKGIKQKCSVDNRNSITRRIFEIIAFCFNASFNSSREGIDLDTQGLLWNICPFYRQFWFSKILFNYQIFPAFNRFYSNRW